MGSCHRAKAAQASVLLLQVSEVWDSWHVSPRPDNSLALKSARMINGQLRFGAWVPVGLDGDNLRSLLWVGGSILALRLLISLPLLPPWDFLRLRPSLAGEWVH